MVRIPISAAIALFALSLTGLPAVSQEAASEPQQNLPSIVVSEATVRPLVDRVLASGTIRPVQEVFIQPLVEGLSIKTLNVDVGDRVKAGDVVAELNRDTLILQKSQLDANKAKAEAALAQYRAQVIEAEANADDAVRQRDRAVTLGQKGTISTSQVEQLTAAADAAQARLNAARQAVAVGEADIKVVEAQLEDIDLNLGRTEVKAPVDGVISARDAKIGAIASGSATPLFTMIRNGEIELVADVPEGEIGRIQTGMPAKVTIAGTRDSLPGKVRLVSPVVDPTTRLGSVHILVDESAGAKSGMYASAQIIIEEVTALALPQAALTTERAGTIARKVEDNVVKQVSVEIGIQDEGFVEIVNGLEPGDLVVAKAGAFVRDGDRIVPVREQPAASN
ncbi:efflux RND transporter periplasmic adaptor subunit [Ciceribacter sp. L1K23]|uniref:efflux RND transporter periplasmic adaptor subunit n=1 Tax=Ciceribacter sp. L1K23 TaxID=2820276 RepID=UPI001B818119|nr:efflux RND transporter periplasmic adaptor subunit [Ciceribacter sp. L1K23]MBR0554812.1 efflux RND transporter periplasmic adaptor subunit [Ciceribacter sp. L1K23]